MKAPQLTIPTTIDIAQADCHVLENGVKLYLLPSDDFEVLRVTFVFHAGSVVQEKPFSAGTTANLLAEGSTSMTAHQIAEQLDYYGSYFDISLDRDYVYISFCSLSKFVDKTLSVAEEILLHPIFPEEELRTYCTKHRQQLAIERTKVDILAREAFSQALFGETHPYGVSYPEAAYDNLKREDLVQLYKKWYTAENCFVVCSGRINTHEQAAITELAHRLPHSTTPVIPLFPSPVTRHTGFVERADAVQSSIRIGRLLFARQHPDFVGMQVVAAVLGGYFGSRLMRNLREEHGYTYGVMAGMINCEREGYFAIATQVGTAVTQAALNAIYDEIEHLRQEQMAVEELNLVKNIITGEMMRILDGPFGIADVTIENILCGTDNHIIEEDLRRIHAITPEKVQQLAVQYLAHADLITVLAGQVQPNL
ncbi:MAG: pitrilysin family protein [Alistipes sp.]